MRPAQISLIICTYEQPGPLQQVLQGVERQSAMPGEILIADDGSGAPTRDLISQWQKRLATPLRHIWQPKLGFRRTFILNQAMAAAKGDYIVMLDGDCVPHPKFIADHSALAERNFWVQGRRCFVRENIAATFSPVATPIFSWILMGFITGSTKAVRLPFALVRRDMDLHGILGCNMGIWRDDLLAVNGFDEEYTGWGIEDSDLGARLYQLGRSRKFVHGHAIIYHLNHPMLGRSHVEASRARLAETIRSRKIRCERGVAQYLSTAGPPA
jgi:glycosyltransferase involved in cell wall biosynthesis